MKRILVIDDDPAIRLLYQEELVEEGYEVISSDGGKGLLEVSKEAFMFRTRWTGIRSTPPTRMAS